jgi:DNA-binding beta-propeller fold protein YncE
VIAVGSTVLVADMGNFDNVHPGQVLRYNLADGSFLSRVDTTGFDKLFAPRGLVLGPDGLLYVAVVGNLAAGDRATGYVVRFQWDGGNFKFKDVFVASDASNSYAPTLHRPEGIVFGPDGNLYVTTFLQGSDLDGVLGFNPAGQKISRLDWWAPGQTRVFAQAILFGPGGDLFVPVSSDYGVRRYSAASGFGSYSVLPRTGKAVKEGLYLSFRETNPATLAYEP